MQRLHKRSSWIFTCLSALTVCLFIGAILLAFQGGAFAKLKSAEEWKATINSAYLAECDGRLEDAERLYTEALPLARGVSESDFRVALTYEYLSYVAEKEHDETKARQYLKQAIVPLRVRGNHPGFAREFRLSECLLRLATKEMYSGDLQQAKEHFGEALSTAANLPGSTVGLKAEIGRQFGRCEELLHMAGQPTAANMKHLSFDNFDTEKILDLLEDAQSEAYHKRWSQAVRLANEALTEARRGPANNVMLAKCYSRFVGIYWRQANWRDARINQKLELSVRRSWLPNDKIKVVTRLDRLAAIDAQSVNIANSAPALWQAFQLCQQEDSDVESPLPAHVLRELLSLKADDKVRLAIEKHLQDTIHAGLQGREAQPVDAALRRIELAQLAKEYGEKFPDRKYAAEKFISLWTEYLNARLAAQHESDKSIARLALLFEWRELCLLTGGSSAPQELDVSVTANDENPQVSLLRFSVYLSKALHAPSSNKVNEWVSQARPEFKLVPNVQQYVQLRSLSDLLRANKRFKESEGINVMSFEI